MVKKVVLVILALAALGQAAYLTYGYMNRPGGDDEQVAADFACSNSGCGHSFSISRDELVRVAQNGGAPECPQCKTALTRRAMKCPACKEHIALIGHGQIPPKCEKCGRTISVDAEGVPFCP